jgi:hypothetical protein
MQSSPGDVVVQRISEKVEIDDAAIQFLAAAKLTPGSRAVVLSTEGDGVRVESDAGDQVVPRAVAQLMWVVPA